MNIAYIIKLIAHTTTDNNNNNKLFIHHVTSYM